MENTVRGLRRVRFSAAGLSLFAAASLAVALAGCGRAEETATETADTETQQMEGLRLAGYQPDGGKRWELVGDHASIKGDWVTIQDPDGVGYDEDRTAYLQAKTALVNQKSQEVLMQEDVVVHTSDGIWLMTPEMLWVPEAHVAETDAPVRIEGEHILLRGRGAVARTELRLATLLNDVELVLNPSDHDGPDTPKQVIITCDGPLTFDYQSNVATFHENVHVVDGKSELFSDKLVAYLDQKDKTIRYAEAEGNVRIIQEGNEATSEKAVYEPAYGRMTLLGKPSLQVQGNERQSMSIPLMGAGQ